MIRLIKTDRKDLPFTHETNGTGKIPYKIHSVYINGKLARMGYRNLEINDNDICKETSALKFTRCTLKSIKSLPKNCKSIFFVYGHNLGGGSGTRVQAIKNISLDTLQTWFTNPEMYQKEISDLLTYYYIVDGNISALFDMIFSLPELTYSIEVYERTENYEEDMKKIKIALEKDINHKRLTRQLLVQLAHEGTVLGTWLGTKKSYWFEVFHDLEYIYPWSTYKNYGMVGVFDLAYIDTLTSDEKKALEILKSCGEDAYVIGEIIKSEEKIVLC